MGKQQVHVPKALTVMDRNVCQLSLLALLAHPQMTFLVDIWLSVDLLIQLHLRLLATDSIQCQMENK